jgi:flagellar hook-associated protein 1 FlgK
MSSLFNIGKSGLDAARQALAVTGENIANVETPGYKRRSTVQAENGAAQASPLILGSQSQGVSVTSIRRAFDELLANRVRTAGSTLSAAEASVPHLEELELRLSPSVGGVPEALDGFFDSIASMSGSPEDAGLRNVVMETGKLLASTVADLAVSVETLVEGVHKEAGYAIDRANEILTELGEVFASIGGEQGQRTRNPLLDRRDNLLQELSSIMEIHVSYEELGQADIRFGNNSNGPILMQNYKASFLSLTEDGRVSINPPDPKDPDVIRTAGNGVLKGLKSASAALGQTLSDLNRWAQSLTTDMNAVHSSGVDRTGAPGGALFQLSGWDAKAAVINRGTAVVQLEITDADATPEGPLSMAFDAGSQLWSVQDPEGNVLGQGSSQIAVPGLLIKVTGSPIEGDRFSLKNTEGAARNMSFVPTEGSQLAAASALNVGANAGNLGNAVLSVVPSVLVPADAPDLAAALSEADGGVLNFLQPGVVGQIPAGSGSADLVSLPRDAMMEFAVPIGETASAVTLNYASGAVSFTAPSDMAPESFAAALNDGSLLGPDDQTLADLGLVATAEEGAFALMARSGAELPDASLTTSAGNSAGLVVQDAADAADIAVFTREGRQLSGTPLSPEDAAALLTEANGFSADAAYRYDTLNKSEAYGPLALDRAAVGGAASALMGGALVPEVWTGSTPPASRPAETVLLDWAGQSATIEMPQGASAAQRAAALNDALPVEATATTAMTLDLPVSGTASFRLTGADTASYAVSANLDTDGLPGLATAINAVRAKTGITAEVSPDGARLQLYQRDGETITLSRLTLSSGGPATVTRLDDTGAALGAAVAMTADGTGSAKVEGTVRLTMASEFSVSENGAWIASAPDGFAEGAVSRSTSLAGSQQVLDFAYDAGLQGLRYGSAGASPVTLTLTGGDGRSHEVIVDPALSGGAANANLVMAEALRAEAPASRITGAAMASLPPDGAQLGVTLGSEAYMVTMSNGAPVVTGPQEGRVTARFDHSNRLIVETEGGHLDGAALRLASAPLEAARFGMGLTDAPEARLMGGERDGSGLPASFDVSLEGTTYTITATAGGLTPPADFPGSAEVDPDTGNFNLVFDARLGPMRIAPQAGAAAAGFDTMGIEAQYAASGVTLTATDGRVLDTAASSAGSGTRLSLDNLPNEDLLVVMQGDGALRLDGTITEAPANAAIPARELRVLDADAGLVGLYDTETGAEIGRRMLDASGAAQIGGMDIALSGTLSTGDSFAITSNGGAAGDASNFERLADLVRQDERSGLGGFAEIYAEILSDVGAQVSGGKDRIETAQSLKDSVDQAEMARSAVDLDTEAANLLQYQQSYQANAQVLSVARQLFDTLIGIV